jgi:osmotically-inducible protein OsmY
MSIANDVRHALAEDPRIPYDDEIAIESFGGAVQLRGAALQRMMWGPELDSDFIDVKVDDGWVTLSGYAGRQYQSDKAFDHVTSLYGVTGITNEIHVEEPL